jgi:hypothetical protein
VSRVRRSCDFCYQGHHRCRPHSNGDGACERCTRLRRPCSNRFVHPSEDDLFNCDDSSTTSEDLPIIDLTDVTDEE